MSGDLISREALANKSEILYQHTESGKIIPWSAVRVCAINNIPAVDAEPVRHSRWKYFHKQNRAVCMTCSFERDLDENFGRAVSCPNCGAKMRCNDETE